MVLCMLGFVTMAPVFSQSGHLKGNISSNGQPVQGANIVLHPGHKGIRADSLGNFELLFIPAGKSLLKISAIGYQPLEQRILVTSDTLNLSFELSLQSSSLNEVVVTGTLKPVTKLQSAVAVEVYSPQFFRKNPTPSIFESLQNVNGVRPQINCSVCNTGDIHINGLEGPYTMVTIDGMPIVSSLATVYGLFGIPNSLIERIEIVKGPASSLYGSEAVGGLINIITKNPVKAPLISADIMTTNWLEHSADVGLKFRAGKKTYSLLGINYFNYQNTVDKNKDGFTDVTLQHRISVFNKWSWQRAENRLANIAARVFYEDRWGGDMRYTKKFRGTDSIYGESIYTTRLELLGNYQLPLREKLVFSYSYNYHNQNSYYGITPYFGKQHIGFGQLTWDKKIGERHDLLAGAALRYTYYDDNSTATADSAAQTNSPDKILLPGLFVQDEIKLSTAQKLLLGIRYDHHSVHGNILTPRIAYKISIDKNNVIRLNAGTGFRVVNLFTEDHAALTGAREVIIEERLKPERSYNMNLNYTSRVPMLKSFIGIDASVWYTHFTNQIFPDYETDPNKIIYSNLNGYAESKGFSMNVDYNLSSRFKAIVGVTVQNVTRTEKSGGKTIKSSPVLIENWSGTWLLSYTLPIAGLSVDYTGNIYGPMKLPLISEFDPRRAYSPVWSIQNIQFTKKFGKQWEVYAGLKNLLNWTPAKNNPFIIARTNDPFDKKVQYEGNGKVRQTADNPYALTFDPTYVYAPNQGRRGFIGMRFTLSK
ncbi:MAG: TonB-dependent receptor [Chitinophagaceae bacterium]|nr:TonB-dependent receptor [Chitinophagaceae bacterium]